MAKKKEVKNEELNVEVVSPEEDQKKLEASLDVIQLCREKSEVRFDEAVEKERHNIFTTYKKARTKNNIIMAVTVIIMIVSFVLMVQFPTWGPIAGGVAIGVTVVFLLVHYILTKNLFPNTTKNYIRFFMETSDNFVFDIPDVHDQKLYYEKRYAIADSLSDRAFKDVVDIASRNIVTGTYKEKPFECGELALYRAGAKKYQKEVMFVGKYLTFENKLHFEDRYIIQIKGDKETDKPNDIDDLAVLLEQNRFVIYGKEGAKFEKDLGKELLNNLKAIDCVNALLNVSVVLWAGHTAVYLSYDDTIAAIPFDHAIKPESYHQLKKNITDVLEILLG